MTLQTIAIVGAGIGGLATAALLARDGHNVTVFDQFSAPRPLGSGLVLQPTGQAVLAEIGALAAAQARGAAIERLIGREVRSNRRVLDVRYSQNGTRSGLAIHRASLFDALLAAAIAAGAQLSPDSPVASLTQEAPRRIVLQNGQQHGPFDLVIDAAGARSPLSPIRTRPLGFGALWGSVDWVVDTPLPTNQLSQRYRGAAKMLGIMPMGRRPGTQNSAAAIFYSLPNAQYETFQAQGLAAWQDEVANLWPDFAPFARQITHESQLTMARYAHGTLARVWAPGLVHIGDAAHQASPQLGQGANMALLDALALARALRRQQGDVALADYAFMRRWHVRLYQAFSYAFTPQYQSHSRLLPVLRNTALAPLSLMPPLPRILSRLVCGDIIPPLASSAPLPALAKVQPVG